MKRLGRRSPTPSVDPKPRDGVHFFSMSLCKHALAQTLWGSARLRGVFPAAYWSYKHIVPVSCCCHLHSFWPRKLSAAPIGVFFLTLFEALVEHFVLRLQVFQVVHEQEAVGVPGRLFLKALPGPKREARARAWLSGGAQPGPCAASKLTACGSRLTTAFGRSAAGRWVLGRAFLAP